VGVRWFRNLPVKVGAIVLAGLATLAFYGLIEANPLNAPSSTTQTSQGEGPSSTSPLTSNNGIAPQPAVPQRRVAPAPRARRSRGS
jgi:hypothetical protein